MSGSGDGEWGASPAPQLTPGTAAALDEMADMISTLSLAANSPLPGAAAGTLLTSPGLGATQASALPGEEPLVFRNEEEDAVEEAAESGGGDATSADDSGNIAVAAAAAAGTPAVRKTPPRAAKTTQDSNANSAGGSGAVSTPSKTYPLPRTPATGTPPVGTPAVGTPVAATTPGSIRGGGKESAAGSVGMPSGGGSGGSSGGGGGSGGGSQPKLVVRFKRENVTPATTPEQPDKPAEVGRCKLQPVLKGPGVSA